MHWLIKIISWKRHISNHSGKPTIENETKHVNYVLHGMASYSQYFYSLYFWTFGWHSIVPMDSMQIISLVPYWFVAERLTNEVAR